MTVVVAFDSVMDILTVGQVPPEDSDTVGVLPA